MKLHIGVDSQSGLTHHAVVTAGNVHDKHPLPDLLHGNEQRVYGDKHVTHPRALGCKRYGPIAESLKEWPLNLAMESKS
jgi:IS5 family transposase